MLELASVNASSAGVWPVIFETYDEEEVGAYIIDAMEVRVVHATDVSELGGSKVKTARETAEVAGTSDLPLLGFLG